MESRGWWVTPLSRLPHKSKGGVPVALAPDSWAGPSAPLSLPFSFYLWQNGGLDLQPQAQTHQATFFVHSISAAHEHLAKVLFYSGAETETSPECHSPTQVVPKQEPSSLSSPGSCTAASSLQLPAFPRCPGDVVPRLHDAKVRCLPNRSPAA